jgi:hypothetical protein
MELTKGCIMFKSLISISFLLFTVSCSAVNVFSDATAPNKPVTFVSAKSINQTYEALEKHLRSYSSPVSRMIITRAFSGNVRNKKLITTMFKKSKDGKSEFTNDFYFVKIKFNFVENENEVHVIADFSFHIKNTTNDEYKDWTKESEIQKARYVKVLNSFFEKL